MNNHRFMVFLLLLSAFAFFDFAMPSAHSQPIPPENYTPPAQPPLPIPDYLPEHPEKHFTLPPIQKPRSPSTEPTQTFLLRDIALEGNTVFSHEVLKGVVKAFFQTRVTLADLEEIRYRLTRFYVDKGYVNSGALIKPKQRVTNGVVAYLIVEGILNQIHVTGNGNLRPGYIKKRIRPDPQSPFNTSELQHRFQLMLQNPLIHRMDGRILPGEKPGEAILELDVIRDTPYDVRFTADNHSSPNLGAEGISMDVTLRNITGFGDTLFLDTGLTEGIEKLEIGFSVPLNATDTLLSVNYSISDSDLIAEPFKDLNFKSIIESVELTLMHPFHRSLNRTFSMGCSLEKKKSRTEFIALEEGDEEDADGGIFRSTALRMIQSYQERTSDQVFALRSTFNIGVNLLDPTIHPGTTPDGKFFFWLGQFQYGKRLGKKAGQLILTGDVQLSNDRLPSMEKFSVGGANSVRGYRENEHIGDNGHRLSLEWRWPIWNKGNIGQPTPWELQLVPFVDYGTAWDRHHDARTKNAKDNTLLSTGLGLVWTSPWVDAALYYGYAIEDADDEADYDLQDDGIHFKVSCKLP